MKKMETGTRSGKPAWRDSPYVCTLSDNERHLGHIVKENEWVAFDATHPGATGLGIRQLGTFASVLSAKEAVEQSVAIHRPTWALRSTAAGTSIQ
jgi:hypothetical protein